VEYLVRAQGEGNARVRITALEATGAGSYWLEVATAGGSGIAMAVRLLVHGNGLSPGDVERMSVMLAGQQPLEIPLERAGPGRSRPPAPRAVRLGFEKVRVKAGVFTAEVLRVAGARVWRAAEVPLWGLVRARSPGRSVELIASGHSGGRSVFPAGRDQGKGSESAK
jgi:hypothetical protein